MRPTRRAVRSVWRQVAAVQSGQELTLTGGRSVARSVGAGRLIDGSIVGTPEHFTLTASLLTTLDGPELAHASVEGSSDSLPALLDRLAFGLLTRGAGHDSVRLSGCYHSVFAGPPGLPGRPDGVPRGTCELGGQPAPAGDCPGLHLRPGSPGAGACVGLDRRSERLSNGPSGSPLAGRQRLDPADRALLDIWTGPFQTGPELIDRWQEASAAYPHRAETWYGLGDAYYHQALSAGVADPFRLAAEAFHRGWAIDSAGAGDPLAAYRSPAVAEPLRHMVELAQTRHDSPSVLRLVSPGLTADSTSRQGWYLRWHRAVALGAQAQRAFWADSQSVNPEAFGLIFQFIESSGVAVQDYARAANLDIRHWEASRSVRWSV